MKFDIAAKVIDAKQRAWVVHAGRARVNYPDFVAGDVAFLETPYLKLERPAQTSRNNIRRAIRRALAWQVHHETTGSKQPSSRLADYRDDAFDDDNLRVLSGSISRLFVKAKEGDLIIVPGREQVDGLSVAVIRIGEIVSEFDPTKSYSGSRAKSQDVPFRAVR